MRKTTASAVVVVIAKKRLPSIQHLSVPSLRNPSFILEITVDSSSSANKTFEVPSALVSVTAKVEREEKANKKKKRKNGDHKLDSEALESRQGAIKEKQ